MTKKDSSPKDSQEQDASSSPPSNRFLWVDLFSRKSETENIILSTLKANLLFKQLSPKELTYLSKVVHLRQYDPDEVIFTQYEKGLGMYMIAKGNVDIKVRAQDPAAPEILITTLSSGSFFGELALIDSDNKRTATAYAQGPTILIGFFKPDLLEIMDRKPETGVKILFALAKVLGKRLTETTELISSIKEKANNQEAKKSA